MELLRAIVGFSKDHRAGVLQGKRMNEMEETIHLLFESYHRANYHDGDDTFDATIFAMNDDGDEYLNEFVQNCYEHFYHPFELLVKLGGDDLCTKIKQAAYQKCN